LRKVKRGKNCVFWSYSGKKQFFPYCYNSLFGFFETRSSNLIKDYISKGINLFNSEFYHKENKEYGNIKNYYSKVESEKIFKEIYSDRLIRAFTTYSKNLEMYEKPDFINFHFDNYGYFLANSIISSFLIENQKSKNKIEDKKQRKIFDDNRLIFICSNEKRSLLSYFGSKDRKISLIDEFINLSNCQDSKMIFVETFPYWLSKTEIKKLENLYLTNKDEIENLNSPNEILFKFYIEKFYSNMKDDSFKIIQRYIAIQKTWNFLIYNIRKNNIIILDGSFADFRFFPFLSGFFPQKSSGEQIFDIYLFGDNLTLGIGKNIYLINNKIYNSLSEQPYFNPFGFDILYSNLRRIISQYHYTINLRYLSIIQSRKKCEVIGPYIYDEFIDNKPYLLTLKIPDEIFYFILRLLKDKEN